MNAKLTILGLGLSAMRAQWGFAQAPPGNAAGVAAPVPAPSAADTNRSDAMNATRPILGLLLMLMAVQPAFAQAGPQAPATTSLSSAEQEIATLSKDKWRWMAERNVEALDKLFAEEAIFVHMGATMSKSQELNTIKGGGIQYKDAQIQEVSVRFVGATAILLNRIRLVAVVGGNEVVNPFNVTEVYVKVNGAWKLASLSFTRLMTPQ